MTYPSAKGRRSCYLRHPLIRIEISDVDPTTDNLRSIIYLCQPFFHHHIVLWVLPNEVICDIQIGW